MLSTQEYTAVQLSKRIRRAAYRRGSCRGISVRLFVTLYVVTLVFFAIYYSILVFGNRQFWRRDEGRGSLTSYRKWLSQPDLLVKTKNSW